MKTIAIRAFFCVIVVNSFSCHSNFKSFPELDEVQIHFVNQNVMTPFRIDCSYFEDAFKSTYRTEKIIEKNQLLLAKKCFEVRFPESDLKGIDVRAKIYLLNQGKVWAIYCCDNFGNLMEDGKIYRRNKLIQEFLISNLAWEFK